jgi:hypothetical protein
MRNHGDRRSEPIGSSLRMGEAGYRPLLDLVGGPRFVLQGKGLTATNFISRPREPPEIFPSGM